MNRLMDLLVFLIVVFAVMTLTLNNPFFVIIATPIILTLIILFIIMNAVVRT